MRNCAGTDCPNNSHVKKSVFTFSLDLEHTDGILRAEGAELAGRQRVAAAPGPRWAHVERPHERHCAHHRHGLIFLPLGFESKAKSLRFYSLAFFALTSISSESLMRA